MSEDPKTPFPFKLGRLDDPRQRREQLTPLPHLFRLGTIPTINTNTSNARDINLWNMYHNDIWGCCVVAAGLHQIIQMFKFARIGGVYHPSADVVAPLYTQVTKAFPDNYPKPFNPDVPSTDNGLVPGDWDEVWKTQGFDIGLPALDTIVGFAGIRAGADGYSDLLLAHTVFGNASASWNLPESAQDQFQNGQPWTVVKGSPIEGGHETSTTDNNPDGSITGQTWAKDQIITQDFCSKYLTGGTVIISADAFRTSGFDVDDFKFAQIEADMDLFTGNITT